MREAPEGGIGAWIIAREGGSQAVGASTDKRGIFLQLYNLKLDEMSRKTDVSVVCRIMKDRQEVWRAVQTADHLHQGGEQLTIERYLTVDSGARKVQH